MQAIKKEPLPASVDPEALPDAPDDGADAGDEDGADGKGKCGRKKKDARSVAVEYWKYFTEGTLEDCFYGPRNLVLWRLFTRWIKVASDACSKVGATSEEGKEHALAAKRLQVMEHACGMVAKLEAP